MPDNNWRAGASQPSVQLARFFCIYVCFYPARPHTVMLNVFLNQRTSNTCSLAGSAVTWFCRLVHAGCQRVHTANNLYCCSLSGLHYILVGSLPLANNVQHCASYRTSCMSLAVYSTMHSASIRDASECAYVILHVGTCTPTFPLRHM